jgi:diguanylate cyclase (GGDEF)-like protein
MKRRMGVLLSWALEDPLTHLANRRALLDRLGVAMRKSERTTCPGALLFIDLDDFKRVNDVNGHAVGDAVLIEVAKRTRALIRDADTVARIGGDEFVVLIDQLEADPAVALAHAKAVAAKLLRRLRQIHVSSAVCSASVGVTLFAGETVTREQLLSRADHAMYKAKSAGKNRVRVLDADTPQMHALAS